jgi:predicted metal-dependent hydrolase
MGVWSMTGEQLSSRADQIAENAFLKLIGRLGMAAAFPVLIASMTWLGSTLWSLNTEQAKLSARIDVLTERIGVDVSERYRASDAKRDLLLRDQKDAEQDRRIEDLLREIRRIVDRLDHK